MPVQARDHRKRRSKLISAENTQRDYALAALYSDRVSVGPGLSLTWQPASTKGLAAQPC